MVVVKCQMSTVNCEHQQQKGRGTGDTDVGAQKTINTTHWQAWSHNPYLRHNRNYLFCSSTQMISAALNHQCGQLAHESNQKGLNAESAGYSGMNTTEGVIVWFQQLCELVNASETAERRMGDQR